MGAEEEILTAVEFIHQGPSFSRTREAGQPGKQAQRLGAVSLASGGRDGRSAEEMQVKFQGEAESGSRKARRSDMIDYGEGKVWRGSAS